MQLATLLGVPGLRQDQALARGVQRHWKALLVPTESGVAFVDGRFAGYVTLNWQPTYPPFTEAGIPEIQDLNVLPEFQRRRIASRLLDEVEALAGKRSSVLGIGVGLHPGYNAAQRLYGKRGYIPDGRGITYRDRFLEEGAQIVLDDDLVLHLTKQSPPELR